MDMTAPTLKGRLPLWAAAFVIARRDFTYILFSRSFFFFLLGPLFPLVVGVLAGSVGHKVENAETRPAIALAMSAPDVDALMAANQALAPQMNGAMPDFMVLKRLKTGEPFNATEALKSAPTEVAAIATGTLAAPILTGPQQRIENWNGPLALVAGHALHPNAAALPRIMLAPTKQATTADRHRGQMITAQAGQTLLFLLTMLLAGMVLSNLVEEKGNKIIEILAAAIPMDAVFLGKLFAMLAVSLVGITCWGLTAVVLNLALGIAMPAMIAPAVGWPLFIIFGVVYFAMGYLLIGSVFLAIGSLATTVRDVQTLNMPATMLQLLVFFIASFAMTQPGSAVEIGAAIFPFSSPFAMLARAATSPVLWTHAAAIAWQAICVALFIRMGAAMFRKRVMKSGPAGGKKVKRRWFGREKTQ
ncbi:MAG: hypothetical protein RLY97_2331 [Pseudomonadota bacterium]|jgi:ABC-2 type transport system permease protein